MSTAPRRSIARIAATAAFFAAVAAPSTAFAAPSDPGGVEPTSRGEAIVGFVAGALPASLAPGAELRGLDVTYVSTGGSFAVVRADNLAEVRSAVRGLPGLRFVEDNVVLSAQATPNDSQYGSQYGPPMMQFPTAWNQGYGSSSIKVAVIDSGIRRTHQDFQSSRVLQGKDWVNNDMDPADDCGHGTHTAGTVGATTNNALGVAGMSQATIMPLKVLDAPDILGRCSGSVNWIADAIRYAADNGAKIISMSIGGPDSTIERDAVQYAYSKGVYIVAAAGNGGSNNGVDYPGAYPESVAVAALDSNKARASYSDGGPQVDIAAPGSNVLSTYNSNDSSYSSLSGTSMATPHIAGALALVLSCAPAGTTRTTVLNTLYNTAEDLGAAGRDDIFGYGLGRADRLVSNICTGGGGTNTAPTASFTTSAFGFQVTANGTGSFDPDGDPLTYAWTWGDGGTSTGATPSHTYAAAGTYTIGLTVNDGRGGTNSTTRSVTVTSDPDPSTPNLTSGQQINVTLSGTGDEKFYKIAVPSGASQLQVVMTGPACGLLGCSFDADLYTRVSARPNDTTYTCRPYAGGSNETCTHASPAAAYWYIRVDAYTGGGTVTLKATIT